MKNKGKSVLTLSLCAILALGLVGCGNNNDTSSFSSHRNSDSSVVSETPSEESTYSSEEESEIFSEESTNSSEEESEISSEESTYSSEEENVTSSEESTYSSEEESEISSEESTYSSEEESEISSEESTNSSEEENVTSNEDSTLEDDSSEEANTKSVFENIKNYLIVNGEYDSENNDYSLKFGYVNLGDSGLEYCTAGVYNATNKEIGLQIFLAGDTTSTLVDMDIDVIDGVYDWSYIDGNDCFMMGSVEASTFNADTILEVSYYSGISTTALYDAVRNMTKTLLEMLLADMTYDYSDIGITAYDLGFVNYMLEEDSSEEANTKSVFENIKNYLIVNGEYDSENNDYSLKFGYVNIGDSGLGYCTAGVYDATNKEISLQIFLAGDTTSTLVDIDIDVIDGVYDWSYIDGNDCFMTGSVEASTFNADTILEVSYYSGISTTALYDAVRNMTKTLLDMLLADMTYDYSDIGITAYDLGFINLV